MYLKSLAIQGFKSFADKTNICFEKNITAVVGPNGSGKSNISDAIRWVLGEQSSKTLRGSKMEDVIFAGTEKRPPVGFAEVSLTLDNSDSKIHIDSTEVTATRRYFRSGESEFFINRQPVRLKDIHELFMDTGMGRDGYSVIGQGKIDEILAVKSDERRDFFEEAAGITKYRYRKEEAESKLKAAEENLTRIRDIVSELESRVGPLSRQCEKAKKFLSLRDELRVLEVSCRLDDIDKNNILKSKLNADLSIFQGDVENIRNILSDNDSEIETLTRLIHQKDSETEKLRNELVASDGLIAKADNDITVCETKIISNNENIMQASAEFSQHDGKMSDISDSILQKKSDIKKYVEQLSEYSEKIAAASVEADTLMQSSASSEAKANAIYSDERAHSVKLSQLSSELASVTSLLDELETRLSDINQSAESKKAEYNTLLLRQQELNEQIDAKNTQITSVSNSIKGFQLKIDSVENKLSEILGKKQELEIKLKTLSAKTDMLREAEKQYDGFSHAVKHVMKQAKSGGLKNICGTVADLLKVPEAYVTAIETTLGGAVANIITETETDAKSAINYLKSNNLGRATFLPLSSIKSPPFADKNVLSEDGVCGLAASLCEFDNKYANAIQSLLGRVVIAENLNIAIKIADKYSHRFKIVTLDGQVLNVGGSMTGGSTDKKSGVFSRANELKKMLAEIDSVSTELSETTQKHNQISDKLSAVKFQFTSASEELSALKISLADMTAECRQCSSLTDIARNAVSDLESDSDSVRLRFERLNEKKNTLSESIMSENDALDKIRNELKILSDNKVKTSQKYKEAVLNIDVLKEQSSEFAAAKAAAESSLAELENLLSSTAETRRMRQQLIDEYKQKNNELYSKIGELNLQKEQQQKISHSLKSDISNVISEKENAEILRTSKEKISRTKNDDLLNAEREILRISNKISQIDDEEKQIIAKLWDSYELTKESAEQIRIKLDSYSGANKKIAELKNSIKSLGSVNVDSIREFEEVNGRYSFLCTQKDDLEKSKKELVSVISDITDNMKSIFSEQFSLINNNFNQTFSEIFGGGSASLELTDKNDILNCGIEINVKIPGKSLKTISLLSGGEKAFVAIALYFAILKVRPAPFCVLDEIEAALDDVNVDRYANYLHKLCDTTQFIVITHRRGTMEKSEMLYGVTMQEKGISKLLALSINDAEKQLGMDLN